MDFPGLKTDCETLLHRFQETGSVRFEEFSAIWKDMKFSTIFYGKTGQLEKNKFAKEALSVACLHLLPPFTFQIRVGALYLLYGLYNAQLCQPKQKIRIALKDWKEVLEFQKELVKAQHFDAAYIFRALQLQKSFHYTAMPALLTYKIRNKFGKQPSKEEFKDCRNKVTELITSSVLEEMLNVHSHYQKMKCAISADKSQPEKALSLIKEEFVINLNNFVVDHQQWVKGKKATRSSGEEKEGNDGTSQESGSERANALAKLKSRSYSAVCEASKSRRHRQAKLESSESGSDLGETKGQTSKRNKIQVQPRMRRRKSPELGDDGDNDDESVLKGAMSGRLRMPVIREEEEESSSEEGPPRPKRKRRH